MMNIIHPNMIRRLYGFNWLYARNVDEAVRLLRDGADAVFMREYYVGKEGAVRIAECLGSADSACRYFSFAYRNDLDDAACSHLAEALRSNKGLVVLNIGHINKCTNATIKAFADAAENHDSIENLPLTVTGSRVSVTSVQNKLVRILVRNRTAREGRLKVRKDIFGRVVRNGDIKGTWNRSKLMVIGQARTGKTSTIRSLLGKEFRSGEFSPSTVGASLIQTNSFALTKPELDLSTSVNGDSSRKLGKSYSKSWVADETGDIDYTTELATRLTVSEIEELEKEDRFSWRKKNVAHLSRKYVEPPPPVEEADDENDSHPANLSDDEDNTTQERPFMRKREAKARFDEKLLTMPRYGKNSVSFTIWDMGGQTVFYSLHHLFLTKYGIYLLCFDLRRIYKESKEDILFLKFWLKSVILHTETAPIFLVGTFADEISSKRGLQKVDGLLKQVLIENNNNNNNNGSTVARNPKDRFVYFPIDNSSGNGIDYLRYQIENVTLEQEYVSREVSLRWIRCLDRMLAKKNKAWVKMKNVKSVVKQYGITSAEELDEMLRFYHELGVLLHLTNTAVLTDIVVIRPQWLINALCMIVRDEHVHKFDMDEMENVGLLDDVKSLLADGLASRDLIEYIWRDDEVDFLLDLMRTTMLMSDWQFNDERQYLIPSMLTAPGKRVTPSESYTSQNPSCMFDFSETFLPFGFFERLICLFVAHSGRQRNSREAVLSNSSGTVYFGEETVLHLEKTEEKIYVQVEPAVRASWCLKIMRSMLHKINEDFLQSKLRWQVKFKGVRGYISYELAMNLKLKPWFDFQSEDPVDIRTIVNSSLW
uniref:non-specific serine/threonine protein kinase n=1 Tax=Aplanochytrium stocchinoi TaxID=215587 RepID=A0A6S7ZPH3_9STRA